MTLPWTVPPRADTQTDPLPKSGNLAGETEVAQESSQQDSSENLSSDASVPPSDEAPRILQSRHFNKALKEITPSSSESLGSLSALRKWNEEFGEGGTKKRKIMWGKGMFGFAEKGMETVQDGRVSGP